MYHYKVSWPGWYIYVPWQRTFSLKNKFYDDNLLPMHASCLLIANDIKYNFKLNLYNMYLYGGTLNGTYLELITVTKKNYADNTSGCKCHTL